MNDRDTFAELRQKLDGNDPFMTGGHGIKKIRRHQRSVPQWARSDESIRQLLLLAFPKLQTDDKQRKRAAVWARVIYLYFKLGYTYTYVAGDMNIEPGQVRSIVERVQYVAEGKKANGKPRSPVPAGRPRIRSAV